MAMGLRPIPQHGGGVVQRVWLGVAAKRSDARGSIVAGPVTEIFDFSNGCNYYSTPYSQRKRPGLFVFSLFAVCGSKKGKSICSSLLLCVYASMMFATTPEPTVLPPSLIANRSPFSIAIGVISSISILMLSPGITISTPSGSLMTPVTSVVLK